MAGGSIFWRSDHRATRWNSWSFRKTPRRAGRGTRGACLHVSYLLPRNSPETKKLNKKKLSPSFRKRVRGPTFKFMRIITIHGKSISKVYVKKKKTLLKVKREFEAWTFFLSVNEASGCQKNSERANTKSSEQFHKNINLFAPLIDNSH